MSLYRPPSNKAEYDTLSLLSQHMYAKHRNIFIGIGTVIVTGLTTFVILRNYTYNNRDHLSKIRREIQNVQPGSNSVFEAYHEKLKKRQAEKELQQKQELAKN
ncbi:unnamed protein product [Rotaria sp. Silwood1]|nr:unnamed protein product [Rotaria sp. Silwood1]CAF1126656.1 unnamed protein product [Rotaria sp. Silwood1]CAF1252315.1 unnamed protein product [Rotaria sp. Silwood1]CAF3482758.1 unnamed protein product [Rotaria sp. Silwood1]CAF3484938.1 unnamed protein product [Rotaria sp. Silwood1]